MKILISCLSFCNLTGSELYVYELAKELSKNHEVDIISVNFGGELFNKLKQNTVGSNCFNINSPPNYFLGDGVREYIKDGVSKVTHRGIYYKTSNDTKYDLLLLSHPYIANTILQLYDAPALNIVHSEILPRFEYPIIHPNVKGYIAIRDSIKQYLIKDWDIDSNKISVIGNPFDIDRFNMFESDEHDNYILFVGTYDYLRKKTVNELIKISNNEGKKLLLIGSGYPNFSENWVETLNPCWDIEKYVKRAYKVASILKGRTAIEGWLCGKSALIFDVDKHGNIKSIEDKRPQFGMIDYYSNNVVKQILDFWDNVKKN